MANNPLLTNVGTSIISNLVSGIGGTVPKWIGHGTGAVLPAVTDVALGTASADARAVGVASRVTTTVTNDTAQFVGTVNSGAIQAITECAQFDALAAGNMFSRGTFAALNLVSGDSVAYTWKDQWVSG